MTAEIGQIFRLDRAIIGLFTYAAAAVFALSAASTFSA